MDMVRKNSIIHLDLDAFFASVEQRDNPRYAGKPLIVGGIFKKNGELSRRGVVCSASYQARKYGIHAGMPIWEAQQKCPGAIFTPSRIRYYQASSRHFFRICSTYTPFVEPVSIDEAFLDVSSCEALFGTAEDIALKIKKRVKKELRLPVSVGIASNKFLAKIATNLGKPDGFFILPEEKALDILSELPISKLWGIGQKSAQKLNRAGIFKIKQLMMMPDVILQSILGENGPKLKQLAQGIDHSPVICSEEVKSIGRETTFPENITDRERLLKILLALSQNVGYTARKKGYSGKTITLKIRFAPFTTIQKSATLPRATNLDNTIFEKAKELLNSVNIRQPGIRLLGVKLSSLQQGRQPRQLDLLNNQDWEEKWVQLISSVDKIREKYGSYLIQRAALLKEKKSNTNKKL
ncbi:MAG TPA: DNA polymerase IV [Atribacterota bacterium]|nr:DNA polymerase IV [Atribacterota bacterium]